MSPSYRSLASIEYFLDPLAEKSGQNFDKTSAHLTQGDVSVLIDSYALQDASIIDAILHDKTASLSNKHRLINCYRNRVHPWDLKAKTWSQFSNSIFIVAGDVLKYDPTTRIAFLKAFLTKLKQAPADKTIALMSKEEYETYTYPLDKSGKHRVDIRLSRMSGQTRTDYLCLSIALMRVLNDTMQKLEEYFEKYDSINNFLCDSAEVIRETIEEINKRALRLPEAAFEKLKNLSLEQAQDLCLATIRKEYSQKYVLYEKTRSDARSGMKILPTNRGGMKP